MRVLWDKGKGLLYATRINFVPAIGVGALLFAIYVVNRIIFPERDDLTGMVNGLPWLTHTNGKETQEKDKATQEKQKEEAQIYFLRERSGRVQWGLTLLTQTLAFLGASAYFFYTLVRLNPPGHVCQAVVRGAANP
jgi:hypothetical protein